MTAAAKVAQPEVLPAIADERGAMTPMEMLSRAVERGADVAMIEKLMDLQDRWEKSQARKAFDQAMAAAKADMPIIGKNREVDFTSAKGRTHYRHEDLAGIARAVDPVLAKHGLSYRYRTQQDGGSVCVTCVVSHRDGHFEENSLTAGRDESGNKNNIQAVGSTITYLQRYTLKAALGLAASQDDDGRGASAAADEPITEGQLATLTKALTDAEADQAKFCEYLRVPNLAELPQSRFADAMKAVAAKKQRAAKGKAA